VSFSGSDAPLLTPVCPVPFVSGLCPSDTYKIWKKGMNVRIDTTLLGFEKLKWLRGNASIIFNVNQKQGKRANHHLLFVK
jgi:hypothetical protein